MLIRGSHGEEPAMFRCYMPQVEFGIGKSASVGALARERGRKAFLAIDPFMDSQGLGNKIVELLRVEGVEAIKYTDIQPNPDCQKVDEAGVRAREAKCDVVVGVGGGSALDFAKGVSVVAKNPGSSWDYTERSDHAIKRPQSTLPMIAIPTTSGTGSETTAYSVLNNSRIKEKSTIVSDKIFPSVSVVDPELTLSMPRRLTAATGFDAFAHALESYMSLKASPFSKLVALEAMKIIHRFLPEAVANGGNIQAREQLAWAATLGGTSIANIGVTLAHSLGQPVGGLCGAPHGESLAACTVEILKRSYLSNPTVFAEITAALDPTTQSLTTRQRAERCPGIVAQLLEDVGLRVRFRDFGMVEKDIEKATKIAVTGYYFDIACHPLKVTEADIKDIYTSCL
jgi:alcohol dehydrogenase class IV